MRFRQPEEGMQLKQTRNEASGSGQLPKARGSVERLGQQHTYGIVNRRYWIDREIGFGRQRETVDVAHDPLAPRWFQVGSNAVPVVVLASGDFIDLTSGVPRLNLTACGIVQLTSHNERIAVG